MIDGVDAGKFMAEFTKTLEAWSGDIGAREAAISETARTMLVRSKIVL